MEDATGAQQGDEVLAWLGRLLAWEARLQDLRANDTEEHPEAATQSAA